MNSVIIASNLDAGGNLSCSIDSPFGTAVSGDLSFLTSLTSPKDIGDLRKEISALRESMDEAQNHLVPWLVTVLRSLNITKDRSAEEQRELVWSINRLLDRFGLYIECTGGPASQHLPVPSILVYHSHVDPKSNRIVLSHASPHVPALHRVPDWETAAIRFVKRPHSASSER